MLDWLLGAPLPIGAPAPDFTAPDDDGYEVTLSELRGRNIVLVFYPADNTSVCTQQLCEYRDAWDAVIFRNAMVFGVNPAKAETHADFRKKYRLPFPLLYDQGQKIARAYHCSSPFVPRRTVYLIGPDGTVRYAQRGKPEPREVLASAA